MKHENRNAHLFLIIAMVPLLFAVSCPPDNLGDDTTTSDQLLGPTTAVLPAPEDLAQLQTTFDSLDGLARISVFPGTTLPAQDLTVDLAATATLDPQLNALNPDVAVRLGPEGTQFDVPVRVSVLLGAAVQNGDTTVVPSLQAFTISNGTLTEILDPQIEVTADGLVIGHATLDHFSEVGYKVGLGVEITIDDPKSGAVYLLGETVPTGMDAINLSKKTVRVKPSEKITGVLKNLQFDNTTKTLTQFRSAKLGVGTCECDKAGNGNVQFDAIGDNKATGAINPSFIRFRTFRDVICAELDTQMTVTFNAGTHTTHYSVKVFHTTQSTGFTKKEITFVGPVNYRWTAASVCGNFESPALTKDDPRNFYEHDDCTAAEDALSSIQCEVTYTADDGRKIIRTYKAKGRDNEGAGPVKF